MAIVCTYRSERNPRPEDGEFKRYVRCDYMHDYVWRRKQERSRFDYEQGYCAAADVPTAIREAADKLRGYAFSYVDWPETN